MKQLLQLTLTLTFIAALSGLFISYVNSTTEEPIAVQAAEKEKKALQEVLPTETAYDVDTLLIEGDTIPYWSAKDSAGLVLGYAFKTKSGKGYSSKIEYILATSNAGEILGLSILSQAETPGLGARITEELSSLTIWSKMAGKKESAPTFPWFTEQFKGLNVLKAISVTKGQEWHKLSDEGKNTLKSKNTVTAITGATITTKAVAQSIALRGRQVTDSLTVKSEEKK